jgi:hypothetical protein
MCKRQLQRLTSYIDYSDIPLTGIVIYIQDCKVCLVLTQNILDRGMELVVDVHREDPWNLESCII